MRVAVVACMDARLDPAALFGLAPGDAHVIRNAGGAVTDDVIRSLAISQRLLGTTEVLLVHHTSCGMTSFDGAEFVSGLEAETGLRPTWSAETFTDLDEHVRLSARRVMESPFLPCRDSVRGFVYDVGGGALREVPLS
jgi:carbonic anhydrase